MEWGKFPWWIGFPASLGFAVMGIVTPTFLPVWVQAWLFGAGAVAVLWSVGAGAWHLWRVRRKNSVAVRLGAQKPPRSEPRIPREPRFMVEDSKGLLEEARGVLKMQPYDPRRAMMSGPPSPFGADARDEGVWPAIEAGLCQRGVRALEERNQLDKQARVRGLAERYAEKPTPNAPIRARFVIVRDLAASFGLDLKSGDTQAANLAYEIEGALRQAAVDGRLLVWGRRYGGPVKDNDPLVSIPASYFETYSLSHGFLHYPAANEGTHTSQMPRRLEEMAGEAFYDLHLDEREARIVVARVAREKRNEKA